MSCTDICHSERSEASQALKSFATLEMSNKISYIREGRE